MINLYKLYIKSPLPKHIRSPATLTPGDSGGTGSQFAISDEERILHPVHESAYRGERVERGRAKGEDGS